MSQVRLYFETSEANAKSLNALLEPEFEDDGYPIAAFETDGKNARWTVSIYVPENQIKQCEKRIAAILDKDGQKFALAREKLADDGWIEKTLRELAPVRAGRFVVHGSHDKNQIAPHQYGILIDAGLAFGTGHHGTTAGCLEMISAELKCTRWRNALDLGAGTGVLAIAIAKAANIAVLASDIDPVARHIAAQNARFNEVPHQIECITAKGFNHVSFSAWAPFDLVVANILAGPLQAIAFELSRHISHGATVILSGLLPTQKARILASYRAQGMKLKKAHIRDGWLTLVLKDMRK